MSIPDREAPTRAKNASWFIAFAGTYVAAASGLLAAVDALGLGG